MISVLIPVYNYNISELVSEVHKQLITSETPFEILCYDDCSNDIKFQEYNNIINTLSHSEYHILPKNIGRSAIRNKLAQKATYDWCLFLDADVIPKNDDFISTYLKSISEQSDVIYGGILYQEKHVDDAQLLRWIYGNKREALSAEVRNKNTYLSFLTLNFLIHKRVFDTVRFNEDIPNLRHEDTLFSYNLKEANIRIQHIENPVYHLGLEDSKTFLQKSLDSVEAINLFINQDLLPSNYTRITNIYSKIKDNVISKVLASIYYKFEATFRKNLLGKNPSLLIFDLYRLSYYCTLKSKR
ncbi:glycosyltransferase involved in cell wall biosynthesis [Winogradskyella pacifica]|uniref:Glycosyltransferase involved in cell wall biosynthesis n=1 Tax=Winogradskyella pacifica TaxID=664642 RepID=A0A3D9N336_9FLAO|nr:glycosyltransferase family 2 protein [Winogradskyella pacifica]REE27208.1 glycosyltransferase involved in cell wall biosynthesis [Winogradskyella pacifica]